jgi:hypothetical protein
MVEVRVYIANKDRRVGAMVKALAVEIAGFTAVTGTKKEFLHNHGYYEFHFSYDYQAQDFREAVTRYIDRSLAYVDVEI